MPPFPPSSDVTPKFYRGKNKDDLHGENIRMIVFGNDKDGSRVMYDYAVKFKEKNKLE